MTNFQSIRAWLASNEMEMPEVFTPRNRKMLALWRGLVVEESREARQEFDELLNGAMSEEHQQKVYANLVKELADTLVVCYGSLAMLGIDGDQALKLVVDNNSKKNEYASKNKMGKIVVPTEIKAKLKKEIHTEMLGLVQ